MTKPDRRPLRLRQRSYVLHSLLTQKLAQKSMVVLCDAPGGGILERLVTSEEIRDMGVIELVDLEHASTFDTECDVCLVWCIGSDTNCVHIDALCQRPNVKSVSVHAITTHQASAMRQLRRLPKVAVATGYGIDFLSLDDNSAAVAVRSALGQPTWSRLSLPEEYGGMNMDDRSETLSWLASGAGDAIATMDLEPIVGHFPGAMGSIVAAIMHSLIRAQQKERVAAKTEKKVTGVRPLLLVLERGIDLRAPLMTSSLLGAATYNMQGLDFKATDRTAFLDVILLLPVDEAVVRCGAYSLELAAELKRVVPKQPDDPVHDWIHDRKTLVRHYMSVLGREIRLLPKIQAMVTWVHHCCVTQQIYMLALAGQQLSSQSPTNAVLDGLLLSDQVDKEDKLALLLQLALLGHPLTEHYEAMLRERDGIDTDALHYIQSWPAPLGEPASVDSGALRVVEMVQALTGELDVEVTATARTCVDHMLLLDPRQPLGTPGTSSDNLDPTQLLGCVPEVVVLMIGGAAVSEQVALQARVAAPTTYLFSHMLSTGEFGRELTAMGKAHAMRAAAEADEEAFQDAFETEMAALRLDDRDASTE